MEGIRFEFKLQIFVVKFCHAYLQELSGKCFLQSWSTISKLVIWGFMQNFHPLNMLWVVVQDYFCKLKPGAHDTLRQWKFKDSQEPWLNGFCVDMPKLTYYGPNPTNFGGLKRPLTPKSLESKSLHCLKRFIPIQHNSNQFLLEQCIFTDGCDLMDGKFVKLSFIKY